MICDTCALVCCLMNGRFRLSGSESCYLCNGTESRDGINSFMGIHKE